MKSFFEWLDSTDKSSSCANKASVVLREPKGESEDKSSVTFKVMELWTAEKAAAVSEPYKASWLGFWGVLLNSFHSSYIKYIKAVASWLKENCSIS